jgi:hypothetical protein
VTGDRVLADEKVGRDLLVRATRGDQLQHLDLALAEALGPGGSTQ